MVLLVIIRYELQIYVNSAKDVRFYGFTFLLVKIIQKKFAKNDFFTTFAIPFEGNNIGEMAEWSNAAVLKTVDLNGSGGSNPSLSAS